jgi:hypothetical protein
VINDDRWRAADCVDRPDPAGIELLSGRRTRGVRAAECAQVAEDAKNIAFPEGATCWSFLSAQLGPTTAATCALGWMLALPTGPFTRWRRPCPDELAPHVRENERSEILFTDN